MSHGGAVLLLLLVLLLEADGTTDGVAVGGALE